MLLFSYYSILAYTSVRIVTFNFLQISILKKEKVLLKTMKLFKKAIFIVGVIGILFFLIWSQLISVSLALIIILDSITLNNFFFFLKKTLSTKRLLYVKYSYIIILPILFAIFFRTFFFDVYYVPSSSMERTLFPGDYVFINKISYGVKVPNHLRNTPVIGNLFDPPKKEYNLYTPLKSFKELQREDIVVFKAVDNSDKFLIKRIIGLPNDIIQIKEGLVFINSKELEEKENYSYNYIYSQKRSISLFENFSNKEFSEKTTGKRQKYKKDIQQKPKDNYFLFPSIKQNLWTRDNYGKLIIPKKGTKIELTQNSLAIYSGIILKFENFDLKNSTNKSYTFKNDYYFMMGDNRHNSIDSRSFGFVPESYIQGKMIKVFSFNDD
jgi:signal peptidase I